MSEAIHLKNILLSHTQKMANKLTIVKCFENVSIVVFSFDLYYHHYLV